MRAVLLLLLAALAAVSAFTPSVRGYRCQARELKSSSSSSSNNNNSGGGGGGGGGKSGSGNSGAGVYTTGRATSSTATSQRQPAKTTAANMPRREASKDDSRQHSDAKRPQVAQQHHGPATNRQDGQAATSAKTGATISTNEGSGS